MRIRTIKPEFWQSESMSRVSRPARFLFVGLWSLADDTGKTRAASRFLASALFPYDEDAPSLVDSWLVELEREKAIVRYSVEGSHYIQIPKWFDHQKIDRPSKSKFPDAPDTREGSRMLDEASRKIALDQGSGNREQGVEQNARAREDSVGREAKRTLPPILDAIGKPFRDSLESWFVDLAERFGKAPTNAQCDSHLRRLTAIAEAGSDPIAAIENGIARRLREPDLPLTGKGARAGPPQPETIPENVRIALANRKPAA